LFHLIIFHAEFAEYTSAQERIALGKKAKKLEASKRKELMQAAIDETSVLFFIFH
jgi:GC-rich sequence DNA-binding factor